MRNRVGAIYQSPDTAFRVWAPEMASMQLHLVGTEARLYDMSQTEEGYFERTVQDAPPGTRYFFRPNGEGDYPDPASLSQPDGVHQASEVVDPNAFAWQDSDWRGLSLTDLILYEIHVGTFTPEGTLAAIIPRLPELKAIGINALELMPIFSFPGDRNWGYDGVYPYSVQETYGGMVGLQQLVDSCHQLGIAVILDVVYNHLGPEGNYFQQFGPWFNDCYKTPWGRALNYDAAWSDGVRDFFCGHALFLFETYHIDGLRCDAIHAVYDSGAQHFWQYLSESVRKLAQRLGRTLILTAESDLNSPAVTRGCEVGGLGFNGQWLDDFHHAAYVLLNPEDGHRYYDFGSIHQLAKAFEAGFVHSGEWVRFRRRRHGRSSGGVPGDQFVVFNQNHDQIGNRVGGERLCMLAAFPKIKLAAGLILLSPYVPLLFMGEEYGERTPFYYFVSHSDAPLIEAVRCGRAEEFKDFGFDQQPPDPQHPQTFQDCKLRWDRRHHHPHQVLLDFHKTLIGMRSWPAMQERRKAFLRTTVTGPDSMLLQRWNEDETDAIVILFYFGTESKQISLPYDLPEGLHLVLDSNDSAWQHEFKAEHSHLPQTLQGNAVVTMSMAGVGVWRREVALGSTYLKS